MKVRPSVMDLSEYSGISFDFYNTLAEPKQKFIDYKAISDYLVSQGYEVYTQELEASRNFVFFVQFPQGKIGSWEEWTARILQNLNINNPDDDLVENVVRLMRNVPDSLELYDDVFPVLEFLDSKNLIISIVTTIPYFMFEDVIKPIASFFDLIVTGRNARSTKGNPRIYQFDVSKKGLSHSQNIFIGDDPLFDIEIPKNLGQTTIQIIRQNVDKQYSSLADYKIRSLDEFVSLLK